MHRRRKQSGRRFERSERVCDKRSLSCPLSENRRPIPTKVPCGHFWRHLLVPKGGETISLRRTCRRQPTRDCGAKAPRGPKPPPAEARHKGAHSAGFVSHFLEKVFSCSFFRRKRQRRPRGENCRESAAHLAERSQKTALFCTIVPGARCAPASSSDIFTSRKQAGLRPAENK